MSNLKYYLTCRSLNMSRITIKLRKNPKNPIIKSTNADTTYPHRGIRSGNSPYARTTVSLKLSVYELIVIITIISLTLHLIHINLTETTPVTKKNR